MYKYLILFTACISFFGIQVHAACEDYELNVSCWDCAATAEDNCTARLNNGVLTVSGTGKVKSLPDGSSEYCIDNGCWNHLRNEITSVVVEEGITELGRNAFESLPITNISLPSTLKVLGAEALQRSQLTFLNLPEGLESFGGRMFFSGNVPVTTVSIPDSLIDAGGLSVFAFEHSNVRTLYCSNEKEQACADYVDEVVKAGYYAPGNLTYKTYEKYGDMYLYNGKFYTKLGDIGTKNYIKKRIYTVEEATKLSKPNGNTFIIRYK
ncbi:MAG: leucine-rich repeat protein [Alphaproteobacteria bacterium]|nr:leucine-rich repeat protein [Alphaproteobacteria bacterium]